MTRAIELDPRLLEPNPWNSNKVPPDNMAKLKRSIQELGFSTAIVVREIRQGKKVAYQILGGKHRAEAAIELGLETVPVVNLGEVDDIRAKKIGLVDNHRYGNDEVMQLAKIFEDIGEDSDLLSLILPVSQADLDAVIGAASIDLDSFDVDLGDDDDDEEVDLGERPKERPLKTHDVLKFRMTVKNADGIRQLIEKTIKREGLTDGDEMTMAGEALAMLLLRGE